MGALTFWVAGEPVQQGSSFAMIVKGRAVSVPDNSNALKRWRKLVAAEARAARVAAGDLPTIDNGVVVALRFVVARGKTVTRDLPTVRPDLDKFARAILDSLTVAGVYKDDSRVVGLVAFKVYGAEPGVAVSVALASPEEGSLAVAGVQWEREGND